MATASRSAAWELDGLRAHPSGVQTVDRRTLARELSQAVSGEVRFSDGSRALYANDGSAYRQLPLGVVVPRSADDVIATVALCREFEAPVFARGAGTGLAGQTVNEAVLLDFSKYLREIVEIDYDAMRARVQPGLVLDRLREKAEERNLTFGPDPATHSRCTLGGMLGNNSCGVHSILAGVAADNVESLDVLLYDGTRLTVSRGDEAIRGPGAEQLTAQLRELADRWGDRVRSGFPQIPRRISGYNLDRLLPEKGFDVAAALVGTESTCCFVLEADLKLIPSPQHRSLVLLGYDAPWTAADHVPEVMEFDPIGLETFDQRLVDNELKKGFKRHPELLPGGQAWLLCEFGADSKEEADAKAERMVNAFKKKKDKEYLNLKLYEDEGEVEQVWEIREGGVGHSKVPGEHPGWPSWEDAAVAPERCGDYLRDFDRLVSGHGLTVSCYFGHVGHGCLHTRLDWDFSTRDGIRRYRAFMEDAADLVSSYGGSLSGEHGDGHARAELLDRMFGPELVEGFREFKAIWDPDQKMNPGKVSDPYPLDTNLRMAPPYRPRQVETYFSFPDDEGSFAAAAERCFGVGACRDQEGVMCPSYQATLEEKHSTRGRARLLFEMMRSEVLEDGWRSEEVKEALDLCLACKGCKNECPVRVDMATYKAEFLAHYYEGRLRPRQAYALGLIMYAARVAAKAPWLANALAAGRLGKRLAGIAPERTPPRFAAETFSSWFARRGGTRVLDGRRVLLWPDTFTNYFEPDIAKAAVEVLEAAGCSVELPRGHLCCGRPLYDFGMLKLARRQLEQIIETLRPEIRAGVEIVGLEPSCVDVFRDELLNMLPHDEDAKRLSKQTYSFVEFLTDRLEDWEAPTLAARAVVHGHCHHRAAEKDMAHDRALLDKLGVDYEILDTGCCGMAGSFGYHAGEHYDVSVAVAEHSLLPKLRETPESTLVIADGFSCRGQIEQLDGREALHVAQVVQRALRESGRTGPEAGEPEQPSRRRRAITAGAVLALAAAGVGLAAGRR
ncbi:MAG TPA: FAD-binding and (Fe-S)-binding domain-containing protein [Gaiellaceae bacterium]|nr:FAD-binding and (Fe-S)-binding domain-containing protein [Gaiellaceae bacterium]